MSKEKKLSIAELSQTFPARLIELRLAPAEFAVLYNATWLRERHGHKTPDKIRAEQLGLETDAATVKLAA